MMRYIEQVRWVRDGMSWPNLNCWGLVRHASKEFFGRELPGIDCDVMDKRATTYAFNDISQSMQQCEPKIGAIAVVWHCKLCLHVGLVIDMDGELGVMDIDEGRSVWVTPIDRFEARYLRVTYHA
jgi:hypothetical protein